MASGANDRRGLVHRLREARQAYRGPFCGADVRRVVEGAGYEATDVDDGTTSFLIYRKDGCAPVPVNTSWDVIYDDDPTFRCLRRDLKMSRSELRMLLNKARDGH